jgi:hypothetical protein
MSGHRIPTPSENFARTKWRFLDTLMEDGRLSPRARCVGYEIVKHLNAVTFDAWPSQETIRKRLGFKHVTQVKRAVADLKAFGYFEVISDRTSRSNTYVPNFNILKSIVPSAVPGTPAGTIKSESEGTCTGTNRDQKAAIDGTCAGPQSSQDKTLKETGDLPPPSSSPSDALHCVTSRYSGEPTEPVGRADGKWQSIKNGLTIRLGASLMQSWFGRVQPAAITDREVVLLVPSDFVQGEIEARFMGALLDAARNCCPELDRVRLVTPTRLAAE